jgi:hypothetical protein
LQTEWENPQFFDETEKVDVLRFKRQLFEDKGFIEIEKMA